MNIEMLKQKISAIAGDAEYPEGGPCFSAVVGHGKILKLARALKDDPETSFDYLFNMTGLDWPDKNMMSVVYHLESTTHRHVIAIRANTSGREEPQIDSVCEVWRGAEYHEREIYDFFGISFRNHPDMRRMFLDETDENIGHPFRKDYVDEVNIIER